MSEAPDGSHAPLTGKERNQGAQCSRVRLGLPGTLAVAADWPVLGVNGARGDQAKNSNDAGQQAARQPPGVYRLLGMGRKGPCGRQSIESAGEGEQRDSKRQYCGRSTKQVHCGPSLCQPPSTGVYAGLNRTFQPQYTANPHGRLTDSPAATSSGVVIPQRAGYEALTGSGRVTGAAPGWTVGTAGLAGSGQTSGRNWRKVLANTSALCWLLSWRSNWKLLGASRPI